MASYSMASYDVLVMAVMLVLPSALTTLILWLAMRDRKASRAQRVTAWFSMALTAATLLAYLRFQLDPQYLAGNDSFDTHQQFITTMNVGVPLALATVLAAIGTFVLVPLFRRR